MGLMLITKDSTLGTARRELGGKGLNLYFMARQGWPVPPWVAIPTRVFAAFRAACGLDETIAAIIAVAKGSGRFAAAANDITALIQAEPLPREVQVLIEEAYERVIALQAGPLAARSSAADEDSGSHSFAGQLTTVLNISSLDRLLVAVKECWASAFAERGLSYRAHHGLSFKPEVAVLVQAMVDAEQSGVTFTVDPVNQRADVVTISAVYGLGEGLVSGRLEADTYRLQKTSAAIVEQSIAQKKSKLVRQGDGSIAEIAVPDGDVGSPALAAAQLTELCHLASTVEAYYGRPQDLEWAFTGGRLWLLQARPITALSQNLTGTLQIWDNSNIVESYGGLTLPLTFSFAQHVYREVYLQLCAVLLVPTEQVNQLEHSLSNMLGLFYGRVYYNLLNWYRLLTIIPGFKQNRAFMETMMGVREGLAEEVAAACKPPTSRHPHLQSLRRFLSAIKLVKYHLTAQPTVDRFLAEFHKVYQDFKTRDYDRMPADQIYAAYRELEGKLLRRWHAPIINDLLCMIHFGMLKKLCNRWLPSLGPAIHNDLMCGEGSIESAEPTRELMRMAAMVAADPVALNLLLNTPTGDCHEVVMTSGHEALKASIAEYIDRFGFRCMNEMKLEQRDLHEDPSFLYACLKNYLKTQNYDLKSYTAHERAIRHKAESSVATTLRGPRRLLFQWVLGHARRAVRNRENTRFCRTRVYGVVRRMFYAWGRDYVARGLLRQESDIFYLTLAELKGTLDGTLTVQDLNAMVTLRHQSYESFAAIEPAERFMTRGPVYWHNTHTPAPAAATASEHSAASPGQLRGLGCCPGVVTGIAKVVLSPTDDMTLNGEILVCPRTDPGWVPLYPSCSGLLVERGSLLSHSAIVAREMGLPTVVSVAGLMATIKNGMRLKLDGTSGLVEIL